MTDRALEAARVWTKWSERRPPNAPGEYRYRCSCDVLGTVLTPEWTEKMSLCGMGHGDAEWWPLTPCYWDGYKRYITHEGLEWSEPDPADPEGVVWGGLELLPCPFTGNTAQVKAHGRYIGAPIWHTEAISVGSPAVPFRRFTGTKKMVEFWNRRAPVSALPGEAEVVGRDIFECANQLGGYVGPNTDDGLARFLLRESNAAADLAHEIVRLRGTLQSLQARAEKAERERDEAREIAANFTQVERYTAMQARAEAAEARVKKLEEALKPFAFTGLHLDLSRFDEETGIEVHFPRTSPRKAIPVARICVEDVLRARTALTGGPNG